MLKLLLLVALVVLIGVILALMLRGKRGETQRRLAVYGQVTQASDLAYLHDEISPALADAIIARTRGLHENSGLHELQRAVDDILDLARAHREAEPDLAVIVIDTVRRTPSGPDELPGGRR